MRDILELLKFLGICVALSLSFLLTLMCVCLLMFSMTAPKVRIARHSPRRETPYAATTPAFNSAMFQPKQETTKRSLYASRSARGVNQDAQNNERRERLAKTDYVTRLRLEASKQRYRQLTAQMDAQSQARSKSLASSNARNRLSGGGYVGGRDFFKNNSSQIRRSLAQVEADAQYRSAITRRRYLELTARDVARRKSERSRGIAGGRLSNRHEFGQHRLSNTHHGVSGRRPLGGGRKPGQRSSSGGPARHGRRP